MVSVTAPDKGEEVTRHVGVVGRGQTVEVDILAAVKSPSLVTVIVTLDETNENDIDS